MMHKSWRFVPMAVLALASAGLASAPSVQAKEPSAEAVLNTKCSTCHPRTATGGLFRIDEQRKSPEGWAMTVRRMRQWHGVILTDAETRNLVKHLADRQGLAPEEAEPFRYALERRTVVESPDDADLATLCARCHSYARAGLQRRTAAEWRRLAHMHLGQWPTAEYQALARDRKWWETVSGPLPEKLAAKWPIDSTAWKTWKARPSPNLAGDWAVAGHRPGKGDYWGRMEVKRSAADSYRLSYRLTWADGSTETGEGRSVVYTGFEWRGSTRLGAEQVSEVLRASADGGRLEGRWYLDDQDAVGATMVAVRGKQAIAGLSPAALKAGETTRLVISGNALAREVSLGDGLKVDKVIAATPDSVTLMVSASAGAAAGMREIAVGKAKAPLMVYDRIASLKVEPETMVARLGGNGGPVPHAPAQFDAVAYTADNLRIGPVPAKWSVGNFDETAEHDQDAKFGGVLRPNGLFMPADAGPNPARKNLNNIANLLIKAEVAEGGATVEGSARLVVAPQRWNDAEIR
ncbi:quinohemoprotein amine dehydrogenase subunit alpha [Paramagnetospirillum caucaseum]|uniref:Quinohemoprotein amine dehydrogenase subunit alpha n=1 Tax=Paramagnetospirillum caucaseum TaxID=1244869 RepID=M2ZLG3_9PROT|nr:quinohemoprotein amine dehydrogenase subunit alpha [Paramagnetospirillum caucaseum]EME68092.1 quinohemoprotein amine dehydrogenase subunit alpha [Paramagnetospirillum caucaseum]